MTKKKSNPFWNTLISVRLTLALLILIAITSILGTVIPQNEGYLSFAQNFKPGIVKLFNMLGFFDVYHSLWFRLIILCLSINLIACSINRFRATLRLFQIKPRPDRSKPFEDLPPDRIISIRGEFKDIAGMIKSFIRGRLKNLLTKETEIEAFYYGETGRFSVFGVYIVHFSVLFILAGAIIGSIYGFEGYVNIPEGQSTDTIILRKNMGHQHMALGFQVQCDRFSVDYYDNGTPKEFRSDLRFMANGKTAHEGALKVNHPITFRGVTFYQGSYGSIPGNHIRIKILRDGHEVWDTEKNIELDRSVPLPGGEGHFLISEIREDFMRMGPAVSVIIRPSEGDEINFWLFKNQEIIKNRFPDMFERFPRLNPSAFIPYTFQLDEIETTYYTGLQVKKDPGIYLVYTGFFMIITGLFITFFTSHRRIWIHVRKNDDEVRISVAGNANKNPVGLERYLIDLTRRLKTLLVAER